MTNEQLLLVMKRKTWHFRIHKDRSTGKNETQFKLRSHVLRPGSFCIQFYNIPMEENIVQQFHRQSDM